ncbi:MAG: hypothetical protein DRO88_10590 [Promethearchaeia archaeon]|nr:MAG: hypothetical protein DRO88_10590 [Candidatus Lokiarchaeia archaeon]
MAKKELFIKRVYEIVQELKIPLVDERVYSKSNIAEARYGTIVQFTFEDDESVIRGFLGLAEYYHTIVLKIKNTFYISSNTILFKLDSK